MAHESVYPKLESESDLQSILDYLYATTKQAIEEGRLPKFKGLLELAKSEIIIITLFITSNPTTAARQRELTA